jgi:glycosyltransferase involved in cell wall biosynthesis
MQKELSKQLINFNMGEVSPLNVLVSAYACGPNWGSEVGMGWNWIINLSQYCQLHVLTEKGFQKDIETEIRELDLPYPPIFYYLDIGEKGRHLFWKQGSFLFYYHYKKWQKAAYQQSKMIIKENEIHLIHQLNLIGFREPGYLWKWSGQIPIIWGPVGGFNQVPLNYIFQFDIKNKIFYLGKNLLHRYQVYFHSRVKKALKRVNLILAESSSTKNAIKKVYYMDSVLMNETGADFEDFYEHTSFCSNNSLNLLWVGKIQGLKALPIALKSLKILQDKIPIKMTIVGDGPDEVVCRQLSEKIGVNKMVTFLGKVPNSDVRHLMKIHDVLFFTSLKEGTPHVVLEALSNGLPVLCHDGCGHGDIINDSVGIKIPMKSYQKSIELFSKKIEFLYNHQSMLYEFSKNAKESVKLNSWKSKTKELVEIYEGVVLNNAVQ